VYNTTHLKFIDDVVAPSYTAPVVVMVHASWCGPCKSVKPIVERLAAELGFVLVGIDGGVEKELAAGEGVRAVPTIFTYKNGKYGGLMLSGGKTEGQIREFLAKCGVGAPA
jgi:putative thioredoxin